jgi:hypothetical protein
MRKFTIVFLLLLIFIPQITLAQGANPCTMEAVRGASDRGSTLPACISQIYRWSLGIGSLLALLMVIFGGYSYMTSAGNAERASKGTEMIWGAIIGLALLFGAYLILNTINPDLVDFRPVNVNQLNTAPLSPQN